jgi:predicted nuclease with TOPRIM domain
MTDWKQMARMRGTKLREEELDKVAGPLEALEKRFRELEKGLALETEPVNFYVVPEGER